MLLPALGRRAIRPALALIPVIGIAWSIIPQAATAATVSPTTVAASADAYVSSVKPTQNHGTSSRLIAKSTNTEFYVNFTIPAAPTGYEWSAASVVLSRTTTSSASRLTFANVGAAWTERGITWQNRPASSTTSVNVADTGTSASVTADVTSLFTSGTTVAAGSASIVVRSNATKSVIFNSREAGAAPTLKLTASPIAPSCTTTERGIPCGTYVGAAVGSNTDPATFESAVGNTLGVRRTYWGPTQVDSALRTVTADIAKGRLPWISFKLPYSWAEMAAGKGDAWALDLATRLSQVGGPVWIAFHHEPEGDGVIADWLAMQRHLSPIVRNTAKNVAYTTILTGWHELYSGQYTLDGMYPGDGVVDLVGFDVYLFMGVVKDGVMNTKYTDMDAAYYKPLAEWAAKRNVAWGVAETGITDYASESYPTWMPQMVTALKARGGKAFAYFNTSLNSSGSWVITTPNKTNQFASALKQSDFVR